MQQTVHVVVRADDEAALSVLRGLEGMGRVRFLETAAPETDRAPDPRKPCEVCESLVDQLTLHPHLGSICALCKAAADAIESRFAAANKIQWREFGEQLPRMVKDVRAGLEEPTFYRGFEG